MKKIATRKIKATDLKLAFLSLMLCSLFSACKNSESKEDSTKGNTSEPSENGYVSNPNPLMDVFFGEQHLHSSMSPDAFTVGVRLTPDEAYQYSMGLEVSKSTTGLKVKKATPYDWVALTDHAEYLGVFPGMIDPANPLATSEIGKAINSGDPDQMNGAVMQVINSLTKATPLPGLTDESLKISNWERQVATANKYYKPGKFTTLIAFEWTSIPNYQNLHRNVFFRDKAPEFPFSAFDSEDPEDLWTYQEGNRTKGNDNIAIPHNGNVSDGRMYSPVDFKGNPIDAEYAKRRALNEPLTEMIQTKGQSETHPELSPNDEFADFEIFDHLIGSNPPKLSKVKNGFVRQALAMGMHHESKLGTNPFKYGIVSGSDSHTGLNENEEFNFHGTHGVLDKDSKTRLAGNVTGAGEKATTFGTAGATGVWAEENTREAIFDAMKRKETFGTSGPLIKVRFFGGWDLDKNLATDDNYVKKAYDQGVPMGGDLASHSNGGAPNFVVWALKDPASGNLDRIQIIKVWTENGKPMEKIYNVVWSDNRKLDRKGNLPSVGNTVDAKTATYSNSIGDNELKAVWTDPAFDAKVSAAYYVRVLEIPTPRWSTYDAVALGIDVPEGVPVTLQERAWSSPIWYTAK